MNRMRHAQSSNSAVEFAFGVWRDERGMANVLVTLFVMPLLLFLSFAIVPFFVYAMKANHLHTLANHALKEAEAVGYVSPDIRNRLTARLAELGMEGVNLNGTIYPSYAGSTGSLVLRSAADPVVKLVVTYPAPNVTRMLRAVGGGASPSEHEGFYRLELYGQSEAYE
ncbi:MULTISPECIES: hypothetical protein [Paenibacillus]|uniref:hypothetical protein n=1 Tax=Paenibacillus TaxID=44249 RepID=UPI000A82239B|nr:MULTISPECIES: hypothetical protein [Paenibacillus]